MHIEDFRDYCLAKPGVEECFPFDETTLVFKVMGKIFALTSLDREDFRVNLKCDPDRAEELRAQYPEIQPGYHMHKRHWNTVQFYGELDDQMLCMLIDHAYDLVVQGLPKRLREELKEL